MTLKHVKLTGPEISRIGLGAIGMSPPTLARAPMTPGPSAPSTGRWSWASRSSTHARDLRAVTDGELLGRAVKGIGILPADPDLETQTLLLTRELGTGFVPVSPPGHVSSPGSAVGRPEVILQMPDVFVGCILWDVQDCLYMTRAVPLRDVSHPAWVGVHAPALRDDGHIDRRFDTRVIRGRVVHRHFIRKPLVAPVGYWIGVASQDSFSEQLVLVHGTREYARVLAVAADPDGESRSSRPGTWRWTWGALRTIPVPDPRPGRAVHQGVRRGAGRDGDRGGEAPAAEPSGKFLC